MKYLKGYPADLQDKARMLVERGQLAQVLLARYPDAHAVRTDKALYDYVVGPEQFVSGLHGQI